MMSNEQLKSIRTELEYSQNKMSDYLNISQGLYSLMENGKRTITEDTENKVKELYKNKNLLYINKIYNINLNLLYKIQKLTFYNYVKLIVKKNLTHIDLYIRINENIYTVKTDILYDGELLHIMSLLLELLKVEPTIEIMEE